MRTVTAATPPGQRTRLSPEQRRSHLLDLGVRLFATRSLDELSIDVLAEEAGISRGLLYHYFGNKHAFHEAVVRGAAGGNDTLREIYEEARSALTDRIFREDAGGGVSPETAGSRLMVRGWAAM